MSAFFDAFRAKQAKKAEETKTQQERAANLFSEQDKFVDTSAMNQDGLSRIEELKNITGAETLATGYTQSAEPQEAPSTGPKSIADALRELKAQNAPETKPVVGVDPHSGANAAAAAAYVSSRANKSIYTDPDIKVEKVTEKGKVAKDKQEMAAIEAIQAGRNNVGFLTKTKSKSNTKMGSGLSDDEITAGLAGLRNEGFITEAKPSSPKIQATTKDEIEDLENLSRIVGSRLNMGIGSNAADSGESNEEDGEKE